MSHYFIHDDDLAPKPYRFKVSLFNMDFVFDTDSGVFSKDGLDYGTRLLIEHSKITNPDASMLDLGCGYGPIGIILKKKYPDLKVSMLDVNQKAIDLSQQNAHLNQASVSLILSDGHLSINQKFDYILTNPPIRTGKKMIYELFKSAYDHLNQEGVLYLVMRKQHGAASAIVYLKTIYKSVEIVKKSNGFFIICATK